MNTIRIVPSYFQFPFQPYYFAIEQGGSSQLDIQKEEPFRTPTDFNVSIPN
jgi:hypothetical protein